MPGRRLLPTPRARRWLGAVAIAYAPVFAAGCSDSTTNPSDITGTYAIESFNGQLLPADISTTNDFVATLTDGQLLLRSDRTYRVDANYSVLDRATGGIEADTETDTGTYTLNGNTITVRSDDTATGNPGASGTVSGSRITLAGYAFVRR